MSTEAAHANTDAPRPSTAWSTGSRVWHALLAAMIAAALITQLVLLITGGADVNSGHAETQAPLGVRLLRLFSYFTVQSNVFVLAVALTLALNPRRDGRGWRVARLDALLGITITGVVFDLLLARLVHPVGAAWWVNLGFHRLAPLMAVLGWLLFGPGRGSTGLPSPRRCPSGRSCGSPTRSSTARSPTGTRTRSST